MPKTFEDCIEIIDREIKKRAAKWQLSIIAWFDWDDVSQIIRIHINKKFYQYDQTRPLEPWLGRVISSQIKNLIRNHYGSISRPCLKCAAAEGADLCSIYVRQCNVCPLYSKWEKTKKPAYNIKLPVSLENHSQEIFNNFAANSNIDEERKEFNRKLQTILTSLEYKFYTLHFVDQLSDQHVAIELSPDAESETPATRLVRFNKIKASVLSKTKPAFESGDLEIIGA